jgi:two-component system nitrate/nitrite response regulator NarL
MKPRLATIVVDSRLLVREALKSLMAKHSYRIVCDVGSTAEISGAAISDEPELAILGAQSADKAVAEAVSIRKLWPDCKIILLYEHASVADFQKLLTSEINGCVPLYASPATLIGTLDMIVIRDVRVMVAPDAKYPVIQPAQPEESLQSGIELQSDGAEHEDVSVRIGAVHAQPPTTLRHRLSERELQILDSLVKGHANKVIARKCDITEATVKAHMKSILRKIRVGNRTQAAIWAKGHGSAADGFNGRPLEPASAQTAGSVTLPVVSVV